MAEWAIDRFLLLLRSTWSGNRRVNEKGRDGGQVCEGEGGMADRCVSEKEGWRLASKQGVTRCVAS